MPLESADPAPLPPYTALLAVDVKDFSGRQGRDHARVTESIPAILRQAFRRAGLVDHWDGNNFEDGTGDGYVVGFRPPVLPFLLNPFLPALQEELAYRNKVHPDADPGAPLRMRVAVHVGPMTGSGANPLSRGSGASRVEAHRLLDADPVRDLLSRSTPVTCVAAIVSARVFADAVESGYTGEDPELYIPAPVKVKSYEGTAYLRVPAPSGELLAHGFRGADPDMDQRERSSAEPEVRSISNSIDQVHGKAVQTDSYTDNRQGGTGDIIGDHNRVAPGAQGTVHMGDTYSHGPAPRRPRRAR
ncbi:nucleotidyl cyclase domain-containing protein [Actinokineospora pegani]|uniref:hypothetical protein n=1 Tax=Actinokineospora pegani TaxID=2654637 RepID=UPI0012EA3158|nr:hypothetical protein [Actinokineospora pegani]